MPTNFKTPVGRVVMGNLYEGSTTDAENKPLVIKNGPNAGQARVNFFFALAIPKTGETHWGMTDWGKIILGVGAAAFPQSYQSPSFSWKIEDGDSTVPNLKSRKPVDNEGWAGNWIIKFSGGYAPKIYRAENGAFVQVVEKDYVKPGYWVQVAGNVDGNGSSQKPGVYINHSLICLTKFDNEIVFGMRVEDVGFDKVNLGAPPAAPFPMPAASLAQGATAALPALPATAPVAAPIQVLPNPGFLQVPQANPTTASAAGLPAVPGASPAPSAIPANAAPASSALPAVPAPPSSGPQMTAKANGASREAYLAAGWTDAMMIAQGYMTA